MILITVFEVVLQSMEVFAEENVANDGVNGDKYGAVEDGVNKPAWDGKDFDWEYEYAK